MNVVSLFLEKVTTAVESTAATNAAKVAQAISPVFFAAIALYVIYLIYEITYSQRDVIMSEVTKTSVHSPGWCIHLFSTLLQ